MTQTQPPWRAMREGAGLSLRELARRLAWNPGKLSLIERGITPTPDEASALRAELARALLPEEAA